LHKGIWDVSVRNSAIPDQYIKFLSEEILFATYKVAEKLPSLNTEAAGSGMINLTGKSYLDVFLLKIKLNSFHHELFNSSRNECSRCFNFFPHNANSIIITTLTQKANEFSKTSRITFYQLLFENFTSGVAFKVLFY